MSKRIFDENSRLMRFLSGKGFYVALGVCLVAVCAIALTTFLSAVPLMQSPTDSSAEPPTESEPAADADARPTAITPPTTTAPTTTTTSTTTTTRPTETTVPTTPPTSAPTDAPEPIAPLFVLPLTNEVAKGYSDGVQVYSQTMGDFRVHNGVDFVGELGKPVKSMADGTVLAVETDTLWGGQVYIDHGYGIKALYCGVTSDLAEGDTVGAGDVIGTLSEIPCESLEDPHLHLEVTVNENSANPLVLIEAAVRYSSGE